MEALKSKLKSRRGASILLALLFMLVCMMAGASILMAAAANAGKIQSNKEEQQNYLTVSSAATMLVGKLESIEYVGRYTYVLTPVAKTVEAIDADGNPVLVDMPLYDGEGNLIPDNVDHYIRDYEQLDGKLEGGDWLDNDLLPLQSWLDYVFAENFKVPDETPGDEYNYSSLIEQGKFGSPAAKPASVYTLTFTVGGDAGDYGDLSRPVSIEVELRTDGSILLTAVLGDEDAPDFAMKALLRLDPEDVWPERLLVLPNDPADTFNETGNIYRTEPIRWKLEYIFKEEAVTGGTSDTAP